MRVKVEVTDGLWVEEDVDKEVDAFKTIARITELFKHSECGMCKCKDVKFVCRQDKSENDWIEVVCNDFKNCGAKLIFGQKKGKGGEIYPKIRWNNLSETQQKERHEEEEYSEKHFGFLPNKGWFIYKRKTD